MSSGINFSPVATDTAKKMQDVVRYILGLNISPEEKIIQLNNTFNLVGSDFYMQMFDASSELFDSAAIGTDYGQMTDQIERLSRKIVQNDNLGREVNVLIKDFYDSALGKAQDEAFRNAISLDKHPTLTRTPVGKTCDWCMGLAGVHKNPTSDMFRRHADCNCLFVTNGFNGRNGILTNYNKKSTNTYKSAEKIGVNRNYWTNEMTSDERWFAINYPKSIQWIDKNKTDRSGKKLPTNDYIYNGKEFELKTPETQKPRSISRTISIAASQGKKNIMINLKDKKLNKSLLTRLESYNSTHTKDRQVNSIFVFAEGKEIKISLKE